MEKIPPEVLIPLVEARRVVWDKNLDIYRNKKKKMDAWREICCILNPEFEKLNEQEKNDFAAKVTTRWIHIRDAFIRSMKRQQGEHLSSEELKKRSKPARPYIYKNQMLFYLQVSRTTRSPRAQFVSSGDEDEVSNSASDIDIDCEAAIEHQSTPAEDIVPPPVKRKTPEANETDPLDDKVAHFQDYNEDHPHVSFIKGVLPSLESFDEDETLEFQAGILALIQKIRKKRQGNASHHDDVKRRFRTHPAPSSSTSVLANNDASCRSTTPAISITKDEIVSDDDGETFDH